MCVSKYWIYRKPPTRPRVFVRTKIHTSYPKERGEDEIFICFLMHVDGKETTLERAAFWAGWSELS